MDYWMCTTAHEGFLHEDYTSTFNFRTSPKDFYTAALLSKTLTLRVEDEPSQCIPPWHKTHPCNVFQHFVCSYSSVLIHPQKIPHIFCLQQHPAAPTQGSQIIFKTYTRHIQSLQRVVDLFQAFLPIGARYHLSGGSSSSSIPSSSAYL